MPPSAKSPDHLALGRALRELRTEQGISQEELGYASGLHRNYVGACERGEINLSFGVILRLITGLHATLPELANRYERHRNTSI